jgi:hypothetical protein
LVTAICNWPARIRNNSIAPSRRIEQVELQSPRADAIARANAGFGIAAVHEKRATAATGEEQTKLLNEALRRYLYVVEGRHLRENERADPSLVKESALAAARIAEEQRRWDVAENLYLRLMELLPPTRGLCEARLQRLTRIRAQDAPSAAN